MSDTARPGELPTEVDNKRNSIMWIHYPPAEGWALVNRGVTEFNRHKMVSISFSADGGKSWSSCGFAKRSWAESLFARIDSALKAIAPAGEQTPDQRRATAAASITDEQLSLVEVSEEPAGEQRQGEKVAWSAERIRKELGQLFANRFNCWAKKVDDPEPDDEIGSHMAMSQDRFVEVVGPLLKQLADDYGMLTAAATRAKEAAEKERGAIAGEIYRLKIAAKQLMKALDQDEASGLAAFKNSDHTLVGDLLELRRALNVGR